MADEGSAPTKGEEHTPDGDSAQPTTLTGRQGTAETGRHSGGSDEVTQRIGESAEPVGESPQEPAARRPHARALPRVAKNPFTADDDDATTVIPSPPFPPSAKLPMAPRRISALHSAPSEPATEPSSGTPEGESAAATTPTEPVTTAAEETSERLPKVETPTAILSTPLPIHAPAAGPTDATTRLDAIGAAGEDDEETELFSAFLGPTPPTPAEIGGAAVTATKTTPTTKTTTTTKRHRRGLWIGLAALALIGGYFGSAYLFADSVPRGTTIAGVKVGGKSVEDAEAALTDKFGAQATKPVSVKVDDTSATIDPKTAGLSFNAADSLSQYQGVPINPADWITYVLGQGAEPLRTNADTKALSAALDTAGKQVNSQPVNGTIAFVDGQAKVTQPKAGYGIDNSAAVTKLQSDWLTAKQPITLPVTELKPDIDSADLDAAMAGPVKTLTAGPVTVTVADHSVELPVTALTAAATMVPKDGSLAVSIDPAKITDQVRTRLPDGVETAPQNATFTFEGGKPVLKAGTEGHQIDSAGLAASVSQAVGQTESRAASAKLVQTTPADDQAALEKMGIKEVIGGWTTNYNPGEVNRTMNLHTGASRISGKLVKPGETFSLSDALGPRDEAHGFRDAGIVTEGKLGDGMGGGLSQLSTTLYNASHLAGMVDVEHTPHSQWFSRYPKGREATLWEGQIDNRFKNDTPYGVLIQAWADDSNGTLHVQLWSTKYWDVSSTISDPTNYIAPTTVHQSGANCVPQAAGSPGFTVVVTRVKTHGSESHTQHWTVNYAPLNKFVCDTEPEG